MKKKIKLTLLGNSIKFKKVFKSIYPNAVIKVYPWRSINNTLFKKKNLLIKADIVLICGYDYKSQWYNYKSYYRNNIINPLKLTKLVSRKKTIIFYIDTINKIIKKKNSKKKYTFSRYEFAKKELGNKLYNNFDIVKILKLPVLTNKKYEADIYGNFLTKKIFNFLIYFNLINSLKTSNLKKFIIKKIISKEKKNVNHLDPILLKVPRSLFLDRFLRVVHD